MTGAFDNFLYLVSVLSTGLLNVFFRETWNAQFTFREPTKL